MAFMYGVEAINEYVFEGHTYELKMRTKEYMCFTPHGVCFREPLPLMEPPHPPLTWNTSS